MSQSLIIYHADCTDGWCAAWLMRKHLLSMGAAEPTFHAASYGDDPPSIDNLTEVYIVDFSYPRNVLIELKERALELLVLDHHKTAQANCEGLGFCKFNMNKSGAGLIVAEFQNFSTTDVSISNYVEDRDLWKFKLPSSKQVNAYLQSMPFTVEAWDELERRWVVSEIARMGAAILQYQAKSIELHEKAAKLSEQFTRDRCFVVNCTDKMIISELLHRLAVKHPSRMAISFRNLTGRKAEYPQREYSIRSTDDGPDVSEIAKRFGGGGHKHAAGWKA